MSKVPLVNFIGIGAQKCASSWLYDILSDHPEAKVSARKELDFFSHHYENGLRWYEAQFSDAKPARAVGEVSPSYFHDAAAPMRAKAYNPKLRILVSLRDPVERALSQHRHMARLGLLPAHDLSFESALLSNPTYVEQGRYHEHLARWMDAFGSEQVLVVLMDDIRHDPRAVAAQVYRFLGISDEHLPAALSQRSNESYVARSAALQGAIETARKGMRRMGLFGIWRRVGDVGFRSAYRAMNRRDTKDVLPAPRAETLDALRQAMAPQVLALGALIGRDLSAWTHGKTGQCGR